jgi:hypothetical protein
LPPFKASHQNYELPRGYHQDHQSHPEALRQESHITLGRLHGMEASVSLLWKPEVTRSAEGSKETKKNKRTGHEICETAAFEPVKLAVELTRDSLSIRRTE